MNTSPATVGVPAPVTPPPPRFPGRVYPGSLHRLELAALDRRRDALRSAYAADTELKSVPPPAPVAGEAFPADTVGMAVSGGGIRSATFALGVFQALAAKRLLGAVDFLSTVSGGGYVGGFWGAWLNRLRPGGGGAAGGAKDFAGAQRALADPYSAEVEWLRENGRYLTPAGATDAWEAAAVYQRSLTAIHLLLGLAVFAGLCLVTAVRWLLVRKALWTGWTFAVGQLWTIQVSPLLGFVPVYFVVALAYGAAYWYKWVRSSAVRSHAITDDLANLLKFIAILVGLAVVDSGGLTLFEMAKHYRHAPWTLVTALATALGAAFALGLKVKSLLESLGLPGKSAQNAGGPSLLARIGPPVAAVVLGGLWLVTLSFLASGAVAVTFKLLGRLPWFQQGIGGHLLLYVATFGPGLLVLALAAWLGRHVWFANLSSMSSLYSARLTRAYLGASNPHRKHPGPAPHRSATIHDDQVGYTDYFPYETGGPLHIVNATLNQTVDAASNLVQYDRKGMNLAVGPVGLSVGVDNHTRWVRAGGNTGPRTGQIVALDTAHGRFHAFGAEPPPPAADANVVAGPAKPPPVTVEMLSLGQWVGISGAAVAPGLGARTSRALGFLLCFFNVRLGWWWDSGLTDPDARPGVQIKRDLRRTTDTLALFALRAQTFLFNEMNARFSGTARRFWYLSDGGHFENTAAYELIRRRLPFIVVCDDGCDPTRTLGDFADLVRKARLDFDAEITVFTAQEIATLVPASVRDRIGTLEELGRIDPATGFTAKAALLAWVHYRDGRTPDSLLLLLKPTITGHEPADVLNYHAQHRDFPQQSTADQFFDEAQWESYRRLGQWIAGELFAAVAPGQPLRQAFLV